MESLVRPVPAPFPWAEPYFTVGVTGTNGKTSTTMLVAAALRAAGHRVLSETTIGYWLDDEPMPVPRTVGGFLSALDVSARRGARHAAIEVTSEALARGAAKEWRFDLGVFTNLSHDHISSHGSFEHYLASKAQLFVHLGPGRTAVLNAADETSLLLDRAIPPDVVRRWYQSPTRGPKLRAADLAAASVRLDEEGTHATLEPGPLADALGGVLSTRLVGHVFAENALAAALAALSAGVPGADVARGIAALPGVPGRFEILLRSPLCAVDYAHTPDALARTCDAARELATARGGQVLVVFGAGGGRDKEKREPMGRAVGERAEYALVTNDNPRHEDPNDIARAVAAGARRGGRAHVEVVLDRREAIRRALERAKPADVVVVAGKGHERGQIAGADTAAFSDADVVRELAGTSRPQRDS
ncbi:MAG TPA: UDP-N-acetylmuramyl-tripeptide synthetase [Polyangiaceae bacterium]|nr:UDP-N-acetylmuramyl-tripeptide synthetase [Polyangiaceae bacterium]